MAQGISARIKATLSTTNALFALTKPWIGAFVGALASTAYFFNRPQWDAELFGFVMSVFVLAMGASALNNFQDRKSDTQFERTKNRPLPKRRLSEGAALVFSLTLIAISVVGLTLFSLSPRQAGICAIASVALYNGVYTPLKRRTVLAIVPGTVAGSLPVLLGWTAAGGAPWTNIPWVLMIVIAVWQLPHFWLILLAHSSEYSRAVIPNMLRLFSIDQLRRLTMVWVAVFAVLTLLLPLFGLVVDAVSIWVLGLNATLIIITFAVAMLFKHKKKRYTALFYHLNLSMVLILVTVIIQAQLRTITFWQYWSHFQKPG